MWHINLLCVREKYSEITRLKESDSNCELLSINELTILMVIDDKTVNSCYEKDKNSQESRQQSSANFSNSVVD